MATGCKFLSLTDSSSVGAAMRYEENLVEKLQDNLRISIDELKGQGKKSKSNKAIKMCPRDMFWNTLENCVQDVSKECTKLSVAFSKPPVPSKEAAEALVNELDIVMAAMHSTYKAFNVQEGIILHNMLKTFILNLTQAVLEFISAIRKAVKDDILRTVGIVWECCESLNTLPKDSKQVVLQELNSSFALLYDAIAESEEFLREKQGVQHEILTEDVKCAVVKEGRLLLASIGLAKVAKSLLKKITKCVSKNGRIDDVEQVNELNTLTETVKLVSPSVDDIFCSIYSESLDETQNEGVVLAGLVNELLQLCRCSHFCSEEDISWLDFLSQALDHNLKKLTVNEENG